MARIEDIERRLLNWARWKASAGSGVLGYAQVKLQAETSRAGYRESVIPTSDCEAAETDEAVQALSIDLRRTVEVFYLSGRGHEDKARRLGIAVPTLKARIDQAHVVLHRWLLDRDQARRDARARVEQLVQMARP